MKPRQIIKQTTIKDVAKEAGVSVASVSRALNGLGGLSEETRQMILDICERLNYVPNTLARGLVMQHTQTLGMVVPDITSPFYSKLMELAETEARLLGYQLLFCNSFRDYEMENNYFKLLIGNQVEGILFFPVGEESSKNLQNYMRYIPMVALNQMAKKSPIPYVCTDELKSGELAVNYLKECGLKKILFIGYESNRPAHQMRVESFKTSVQQSEIDGEIFETEHRYKSSFERGYYQFCEFLKSGKALPEAVIAASDATANGVIKACVEHRIAIPEQLSMISFDNINVDIPAVELTTVSVSHSLHVKRAIELLIRIKRGDTIKEKERHVFLQPELIERTSCRKQIR